LLAVKLGTLPLPLAASPMAVFELVQVKLAPAGLLVKLKEDTVAPEHTEELAGTVATGVGLTEIVYVDDVPEQPFRIGVTVIVAEITEAEELVAVKAGTLPLPLASSPIAVLELVQLYIVPGILLVKLLEDMVAPEHTVELAGPFTEGNGLTVIV